ncbi:MAG: hypothetical protein HYX69_09035 [Planctomycetia bacterium]|nr:hypothetical protein [Planctomycetia bacterium]
MPSPHQESLPANGRCTLRASGSASACRYNAQGEVFHKADDYAAFIALFERACERIPMRILGWCVPQHGQQVLVAFDGKPVPSSAANGTVAGRFRCHLAR